MKRLLSVAAPLLAVLLLAPKAFALEFTPTEQEWLTWPDYCRARYVVSAAGRSSEFALRVSHRTVAEKEAEIGDTAWHWLHHFCAGLVYMARAEETTSQKEATFLRASAQRQFIGQYQRVPPADPFFPTLVMAMARLARDAGDRKEALKMLQQGISAHPRVPSLYSLAALILRDSGDTAGATKMLLEGNEATSGNSAEIHYVLGLIYDEAGELDKATAQAKQAYALGYPLPGLRNKLARQGRALD